MPGSPRGAVADGRSWPHQTECRVIGMPSLADVLNRQTMAIHQGLDLLDRLLTLGSRVGLRFVFGFLEEVTQAAHEFLIALLSHGLAWPSARRLDPAAVTWLLMVHVCVAFAAGPDVSKLPW